ncbi:hypothetical protein H7I94_24285, partial [Mycobacterium szulgai]|nr:hypothetical protein [Mycobacterium szulgai]
QRRGTRKLVGGLHALGHDQPHPGLAIHHLRTQPGAKTVFVLPGQGAQYPGMAADLYNHHRGFAAALDELCAALDPHLEVALSEV